MDDENPFTKSQTIDPEVRAYVYSLVNALGGTGGDESGRYVAGDDALAVLRDLKRWLKLYDEKTNRLDVARCLAEAKIVTGDLLPLLASWAEDGKNDRTRARMALACLELLVPLTWPLEHAEMTVNHHRHTPFLQQAQVIYKAGILNWDHTTVLRQAIRIGLPSIAMRREERTPRDEGIIKLMLYFLRNVTIIRQLPNLPSQGLESEVSRSATIEAFRQQDVFALLLTMCSNMGEDFNLQDVIILEILFNLIKGINVHKLWMTEKQRRGKDVSDLKATLTEEESMYKDAKKSEWSRHGRFGTMIWVKREDEKMTAVSGQDNLRNGRTALFNMDKSKKWSKPQRKQKDSDHTMYDFDREQHLTSSANEKLRNFVEEFLDSGFNPLFAHLRKAIEREAERLLDVNYRQFFYVVAWFLEAERVRRDKQKNEAKPTNLTTDFLAQSYALVAAVLNQETFIMMNRYMQTSLDNKEWQDLNSSMRCFTQILLTVQDMAQSPLDEDQEIAENIQNRIFYEETTHDRIVAILKGYRDQGFGYLDACTELSHVFLRMLERYSKENADLQIRSRRRAKKRKVNDNKKTQAEGGEVEDENQGVESENEDIADVVQVTRERKFDFQRFAAKFTSQSSVDTFVLFTTYFRELSEEQLKRAHRFFYRVAFKQDMNVLLYRVDIIALFYRMIQGPDGLSTKHAMYAEWSEFSKQLFRKMTKKLEQRPELFVEMLFSKINRTLYYLEFGHDKFMERSTRPPAELEIKPTVTGGRKERIGVVVTVLYQDEKSHLVAWVNGVVLKAFDERHAWEAENDALRATTASMDDQESGGQSSDVPLATPSYITVRATSAEIQLDMFKNARLKLLMRLCGFEILGGDDVPDAQWVVPSSLSSAHLNESKEAIEYFATNPWQGINDDEVAEDMLRRVRAQPVQEAETPDEQARRDAFIDDSEGEDNLDQLDNEEFLFPDNIREKRTTNLMEQLRKKRDARKRKRGSDDNEERDGIDDAQAAERRKKREEAALERRRKIKSDLYIHDSDDETDEERDRAFFAEEEINRKKQDERVRKQMAIARSEAERGTKTGKKASADNDLLDVEDEDADTAPSSQQALRDESDEEADGEETPLSSPRHSEDDDIDDSPLKEISQPQAPTQASMISKGTANAEDRVSDGEDDVGLHAPTTMRRVRGGFVLSDEEDE